MLKCNTVYLARYRSMKIPVSFRTAYARADKQILVDSRATNNFIHPRLIRRLALGTQRLERSKKIWNIDGTNNKAGRITDYVDLNVQTGKKQNKMRFLITDLGNEDLILGYPWLATFEPKFSWADGTIDMEHLPVIIRSLDWETRVYQNHYFPKHNQAHIYPGKDAHSQGTGRRMLHDLNETSARSTSIPATSRSS